MSKLNFDDLQKCEVGDYVLYEYNFSDNQNDVLIYAKITKIQETKILCIETITSDDRKYEFAFYNTDDPEEYTILEIHKDAKFNHLKEFKELYPEYFL